MTQAQEQQEERDLSYWLYRIVKWMLWAMAVAIPLAIVGVVLGAVNFMSGPVQYPVWVLAGWLVVDILLLMFLLLHVALYGVIAIEGLGKGEEQAISGVVGTCMGVGLFLLIGGGITLTLRHLAWVSIFELLFLVIAVVISIITLVQMRES